MQIKIKEGHAGTMILNDGTKMNYGVIRINQNMSKMIYYTGKGLREMFKPDMTKEERQKAESLKKMDEKTLMKSEHIAEILLSEIREMT